MDAWVAVCCRNAVYACWLKKRKKAGRPLLRSLQAPTPLSDGSPFNVFRWALPFGMSVVQHGTLPVFASTCPLKMAWHAAMPCCARAHAQ